MRAARYALIGVMLCGTSCGDARIAEIRSVTVNPFGTELTVELADGCGIARVTVEETADQVTLEAEAPPEGDDCASAFGVVTLQAPLGERIVIDAATGDEISVP